MDLISTSSKITSFKVSKHETLPPDIVVMNKLGGMDLGSTSANTDLDKFNTAASAKIKASQDKVRALEIELAEAQEEEAQFLAQQNLDIALQALADLNIDANTGFDGEEDLLMPATEMQLFEASKLAVAEEGKLLDGMRSIDIKSTSKHAVPDGGVRKKKRYDPKKGAEGIKKTKKNLKQAVHRASTEGFVGGGDKAGEMCIKGVGVVMGRKTAPQLTRWRRGSL